MPRPELAKLRLFLDIVAQIRGPQGVEELASSLGGSDVYVTRNTLTLRKETELDRLFGRDDAFAICHIFQSKAGSLCIRRPDIIYLPIGSASVFTQSLRYAFRLVQNGSNKTAAAAEAGVSQRAMYRNRGLNTTRLLPDCYEKTIAELVDRCTAADIAAAREAYRSAVDEFAAREAAKVLSREQIRTRRRRKIRAGIKRGVSRKAILADLGISSATLGAYLAGLRKSGLHIDFGKGPKAGTKLDGSAWRRRREMLLQAYDAGLDRDQIAEKLGMNRRSLSRDLRRLAKEEGRAFPLPWKFGPRVRDLAA